MRLFDLESRRPDLARLEFHGLLGGMSRTDGTAPSWFQTAQVNTTLFSNPGLGTYLQLPARTSLKPIAWAGEIVATLSDNSPNPGDPRSPFFLLGYAPAASVNPDGDPTAPLGYTGLRLLPAPPLDMDPNPRLLQEILPLESSLATASSDSGIVMTPGAGSGYFPDCEAFAPESYPTLELAIPDVLGTYWAIAYRLSVFCSLITVR